MKNAKMKARQPSLAEKAAVPSMRKKKKEKRKKL
jgi:hypothetical protein